MQEKRVDPTSGIFLRHLERIKTSFLLYSFVPHRDLSKCMDSMTERNACMKVGEFSGHTIIFCSCETNTENHAVCKSRFGYLDAHMFLKSTIIYLQPDISSKRRALHTGR